jgi:two-component system, NarL family, sensor histidine kinase DegS
MSRPDQLGKLQILAILVPAVCAGFYEALRHSLLPSDLPFGLGTLVAVALVLVISYGFAQASFGIIRRTQARLRERNRELQALSREVQRLAVLEERDRLSREIHDGVAQVLASLLVRLDTIESLLRRGRLEELGHELDALRGASAEAYDDVREAIADLRTRAEPGPVGLRRALDEYVSQFGDRAAVSATFTARDDSEADLPPMAEVQILRIVQEALANVRKHARASNVSVELWHADQSWHVAVQDDGVGFDPRGVAPGERGRSLGLHIMRERAESVGGQLSIETMPGGGTRVHARVPVGLPPAESQPPREDRVNGATAAVTG